MKKTDLQDAAYREMYRLPRRSKFGYSYLYARIQGKYPRECRIARVAGIEV